MESVIVFIVMAAALIITGIIAIRSIIFQNKMFNYQIFKIALENDDTETVNRMAGEAMRKNR